MTSESQAILRESEGTVLQLLSVAPTHWVPLDQGFSSLSLEEQRAEIRDMLE